MPIDVILIFTFGVVFVVLLILIAIRFPDPTPFQYTVFRITLALAASGIAALIPGLLKIDIAHWISGSGALAVFVIVYFYSPAGLAREASKQHSKSRSVEIVDARLDIKDSNYVESTDQGKKVIRPKSGGSHD